MLDWTREVDTHEAYIASLDYVVRFYNSNTEFRLDVLRSTAKVVLRRKDNDSSDDSSSGKQQVGLKIFC